VHGSEAALPVRVSCQLDVTTPFCESAKTSCVSAGAPPVTAALFTDNEVTRTPLPLTRDDVCGDVRVICVMRASAVWFAGNGALIGMLTVLLDVINCFFF
jgi:hypothetical protein